MKGFDAKWRDVPHYINGITHDIWEGRQIGALRSLYAPGLIVRSPASVVVDNSGVIAATLATLAEFPDRELQGEDVIWCDDPEGATATSDAYLSSHRLMCTATHAQAGAYGAPTGARLRYRILADCAIRDGAVYDEWLVRDQAAIVGQMGHNLVDWVRAQIGREGGAAACVKPMTPETDVAGPYTRRGNLDAWGARYAAVISRLMAGELDVVPAGYARAANLHYAGGVDAFGWRGADAFWIGLRAAFPSAAFKVEHVVGRADALCPPRAAVRWSLHGTHSGWGRFGVPSGAQVYVMGISHAEFDADGAIRREFALVDDTAIWKQILLHTGAHA
jgi:predicted ester cyclase